MEQDIAVSVICIVYNHEKFLRKCLEGITMQKTNFPFEVLVHDDCSTDGSVSIIKEYKEKYPDIIKPIYEEENQYSKGVRLSYELIKQSNGRYVAFCEGDDYWCDSLKLQKQFEFMKEHEEYSMCVHNTMIHDLSGRMKDRTFFEEFDGGFETMTAKDVFDDWKVHTTSYFIRKNGDIFPDWSTDYFSADYVMLSIAYANGKIGVLPTVMSVYNFDNPEGITKKNNNESKKVIQKVYARKLFLDKYLSHVGVDQEARTVILNRIEAIEESCAVNNLCLELMEKRTDSCSIEEKLQWIIQSLNAEIVFKWCINPADGLENRGVTVKRKTFFSVLADYVSYIEKFTPAVHFSFVSWLLRIMDGSEDNKEFFVGVTAHPDNTVGWGMEIQNSALDRRQLMLEYSNQKSELYNAEGSIDAIKIQVMDAFNQNQLEESLNSINMGLRLVPLDRDLLLYKAFILYIKGQFSYALDELGVYSLFFGLESDAEELYVKIQNAMKI